jgi:membrane protease YdiL (CAAX protease family)
MKRITEWIKRHQVLAFFLLAYAITWPGLCLIYFIFPGNQVVEGLTGPFAVFSPALAAMLISGIAEPHPKSRSSRPRWIAFLVSWIVSAVILILYGWKIQTMEIMVAAIVYSLIALFPAWVFSSAYARTPGIRKQFSTLLKPRGPAVWYLVVFLIFPGIPLLAMGITRLFGGEAQFYLSDLGIKAAGTFLVLEFLRGFLMTGGINEESGWRGFALPRLQARYPVIVAAGIVWFFWALWHLPYDIGRGDKVAWILENRLFWNLLFSILMVWLYNRTHGSLLAPALFHPAMNAFGNQFSLTTAGRILFIGLAIFAIVSDRMWEKLPEENPAGYKVGTQAAMVAGFEHIAVG